MAILLRAQQCAGIMRKGRVKAHGAYHALLPATPSEQPALPRLFALSKIWTDGAIVPDAAGHKSVKQEASPSGSTDPRHMSV